ncbi:MAG: hypothetical protein ACYC5Y_10330 [Symbiobacteriia bacterium]
MYQVVTKVVAVIVLLGLLGGCSDGVGGSGFGLGGNKKEIARL